MDVVSYPKVCIGEGDGAALPWCPGLFAPEIGCTAVACLPCLLQSSLVQSLIVSRKKESSIVRYANVTLFSYITTTTSTHHPPSPSLNHYATRIIAVCCAFLGPKQTTVSIQLVKRRCIIGHLCATTSYIDSYQTNTFAALREPHIELLKLTRTAESTMSLSRRACYKCGNVGHYAEVCSSSERLCYNCKQPGHESNNCPHPRTTESMFGPAFKQKRKT